MKWRGLFFVATPAPDQKETCVMYLVNHLAADMFTNEQSSISTLRPTNETSSTVTTNLIVIKQIIISFIPLQPRDTNTDIIIIIRNWSIADIFLIYHERLQVFIGLQVTNNHNILRAFTGIYVPGKWQTETVISGRVYFIIEIPIPIVFSSLGSPFLYLNKNQGNKGYAMFWCLTTSFSSDMNI